MTSVSSCLERPGSWVTEESGFSHAPVLVDAVTALFADAPAGAVVDATLGGAGHAVAIARSRSVDRIIGIDRDPSALDAAAQRFASDPVTRGRLTTRRGRFDEVLEDLETEEPIAGVLFDLGVSSPQLDRAARGFSYRFDAPLDMRMDPDAPKSAATILADSDEQELAVILADFGDERFARRIARAVVAARPVLTTGQLVELIRTAIPAPARRRGGHPAKRTFQALRIAVNDELASLQAGLDAALDRVMIGGRIAAISYHSGEDRIVKATFRRAITGDCVCPPRLPCVCGAERTARNLTRGGIVPDGAEAAANPRSVSARLRAVEVIA